MRNATLVVISLCVLLLAACGRQGPTPRAIEALLQQELAEAQLGDLLAVDNVEILEYFSDDGFRHNLKVSYQLEAQQGFSEYMEHIKTSEHISGMERVSKVLRLGMVRAEYGDFSQGDRFNEERKLVLTEDDAGWHMVVD